ncbi:MULTISPECIES: hypothetical protein [Pseudoalteromonas]|uniref:O-antigen polymerase n=1 Tax=Pseudoalteromonas amylolytica TaxID=1859457 RepID=A0A1S1MZ95_9GAMM|nr:MULTISPECIES: hypothetical protein [Pseudoalteromonas]OHU90678.1 hypothetical protein BFC16_03490 [Pseudoalteromonas sp. JW3]OHU92701.1 hypothetical protein BET10_04400 [Pseudoalteromonas amylolytica]
MVFSSKARIALVILSIFSVVLLNRAMVYIDLAAFILIINAIAFRHVKVDKFVASLVVILLSFFIYSTIVTMIYGFQEVIWPMKFFRTAAVVFLLYYLFINIKGVMSYEMFQWVIIYIVAFHSVLIYLLISSGELRDMVYGFTGYTPRGPGWSRSPGVTQSYNATTIVHLAALFLLVRLESSTLVKRLLFLAIILPSLFFLGRTMTYIGIMLILLVLAKKEPIKAMLISIGIISLVTLIMEMEFESDSTMSHIAFNISHAVEPVMLIGSETGVDNYASSVLSKHVYFSDDIEVLLFGNSMSGHMGVLSAKEGETDSDIGVINSINANGIFITLFMYLTYAYFIYASRRGDWQSVSFIAVLCVVLTMKETGFFTSHATPLLLLLVYYQRSISKET